LKPGNGTRYTGAARAYVTAFTEDEFSHTWHGLDRPPPREYVARGQKRERAR